MTAKGLLDYYNGLELKLLETAKLVKGTMDNLTDKVAHLLSENKALHSEIESLKSRLAKDAAKDIMDQVTEVKGVKSSRRRLRA